LIVSIGSIVYDYQCGDGPVAISPVFNVHRGVHHPPRILHFASAPGVFGRLEGVETARVRHPSVC
ncbi:MAG TPA: hypothetical protein VGV14_08345, partial [Rhodanobacter sp.]|nr:hypothetical protein [Rhodanobacter sp.]